MKIAFFSSHAFDKPFLLQANQAYDYSVSFFESRLSLATTDLAAGFDAVSCFVTDTLDAPVLAQLAQQGTRLIALRSAGFNHVDLIAARRYGLTVVRVPTYSPYAVAEFAVGLLLTLNRHIHHAYQRVRDHNFLLEGLLGFDVHNKTVGIIGTGHIGTVFARIMQGFGVRLLGHDPVVNPDCLQYGLSYTSLSELYQQADIISLHCPLTAETQHLIDATAIDQMKPGVMLINTARGGLIDTAALIAGIKAGRIGAVGLDVYQHEQDLFFQDLSTAIIQDDIFTHLQAFPNVLITGHQAFFTQEALTRIAATTLENIHLFQQGGLQDTLLTPKPSFT